MQTMDEKSRNIMRRIMIATGLLFICLIVQAQKIHIKTGIEVLKEENFSILEGKRVGLITNPTGVDNQMRSTVDILYEAPNVNLVALFGPEHGVRGNQYAGDKVNTPMAQAPPFNVTEDRSITHYWPFLWIATIRGSWHYAFSAQNA